jgi:predicted MPP superfamily phosphohydrolase
MKMARRLMIILFVLALANLYVAVSFYLTTGWQGVWWIAASVFFLQLLMPVLRFKAETWRKATPSLAPLLSLLGILSLMAIGGFSIVFFFSALRDILLFVVGFMVTPLQLEILSTGSIEVELWITSAVLIVGVYQALIGPGIKKVEVALPGLPEAFDKFRIVQISDLHIGPTIGTAYVRNVVRAVNGLKPDMIALTGDITDGSPHELASVAKELSEMQAPFGRFFVTGNHEYYHDAPGWIELHKQFGTRVLTNENYILEKQGAQLAILGVPDVSAHHFVATHVSSPKAAAVGVPHDTVKILLAHQPVSYKAAHLAGVNLQLSGHTHSGQFFPWNLFIGFFHDYYRGLNRFKDMWIYVNPGTGYWGPPLRAAVSSEITLLTLVRA